MPPPDREPDDKADTDRRPTAAELRRHHWTAPRGIPALADEPPPPEPDFDWPLAPDPEDAEVLRRAGRDPGIAAHPAEVSAIVRRLRREFERMLAARADTADAERLERVERQVADHSQVIGPARTAASWALRGTVAAVLVVGGFLYKRGSDEQRITDQIQVLAEKVGRLETQVERIQTKENK